MTDPSKLSFDFAAITDLGCERSNNEDSFGYDAEQHIYAVCDGMGGRAAGEVASGLAVRTLIESFGASAGGNRNGEPLPVANRLQLAIMDANQVVREAGVQNPELQSMGTTLVCACFEGDSAVIGNVGDSRAYMIRGHNCFQITQDHSLLAEAIRSGELSPESAAMSNLQSVITRAIGVEETVEPDMFAAQLEPGDVLLLASDGLTRYVEEEEILGVVEGSADLAAACRVLINYAKKGGGADNITCMLLRAVENSGRAEAGNGSEPHEDAQSQPDEKENFHPRGLGPLDLILRPSSGI
jgi:serine/threonine protein phosphatase PrpC